MENIISIQSFDVYDNVVRVRAIVDNVRRISLQTLYDKEECGPALCSTEVHIGDDYCPPKSEQDVIEMINEHCIDWRIIDDY